jgi:hypothetical protein
MMKYALVHRLVDKLGPDPGRLAQATGLPEPTIRKFLYSKCRPAALTVALIEATLSLEPTVRVNRAFYRAMVEAGYTPETLAQAAGVTPRTVTNTILRRHHPDRYSTTKLCVILDKAPGDLELRETPKETPHGRTDLQSM